MKTKQKLDTITLDQISENLQRILIIKIRRIDKRNVINVKKKKTHTQTKTTPKERKFKICNVCTLFLTF